jgi:teichoic acid transport system ATP-binding protein
MSADVALRFDGVGKLYLIYDRPADRLKQMLWGRFRSQPYGREYWALRDVSFTVRRGETVGIIGRNGAGKSTLLQLAAGILTPTTGAVSANGRVAGLLELGSGFNPEFTGRENVFLNGSIIGIGREEMEKKLEEILSFAEIGQFIDQPVKTYSSGMVMRLAFSVVAHLAPDVLIVDEALAVGDIFFQARCMDVLSKMTNTTRLLVSHDLSAVARLCQRVLVIEEGRVAFEGEPVAAIEFFTRLSHTALFQRGDQDPAPVATAEAIEEPAPDVAEWDPVPPDRLGGSLKAVITRTLFLVNGKRERVVRAGDRVVARFLVSCRESVRLPIFGYLVRDRYGNSIVGNNSITSGRTVEPLQGGADVRVSLEFVWPDIRPDEYLLTLGLGDGDKAMMHVIHCWAHGVASLTCVAGDREFHALIGAPVTTLRVDAA